MPFCCIISLPDYAGWRIGRAASGPRNPHQTRENLLPPSRPPPRRWCRPNRTNRRTARRCWSRFGRAGREMPLHGMTGRLFRRAITSAGPIWHRERAIGHFQGPSVETLPQHRQTQHQIAERLAMRIKIERGIHPTLQRIQQDDERASPPPSWRAQAPATPGAFHPITPDPHDLARQTRYGSRCYPPALG